MNKIGLFFIFLLILLAIIHGKFTCDLEEEDRDKLQALKFKIAKISSILVAAAIGVGLPVLRKVIPAFQQEKDIFFVIKAFVAGVILSTAFIRVLPDPFESLTSPCLNENPWGKFLFTRFVAVVLAIGTLMVGCLATSYYSNKSENEVNKEAEDEERGERGGVDVHTHASHGHSHGLVYSNPSQFLRNRVIAQIFK